MYFVLIMKHVSLWCEELPRLKRDVIGFEIELEIECLSDPEWSIGRPTNLPTRDYGALFLFYLAYHIFLALSLWHLVWLYYMHLTGRYDVLLNDKKKEDFIKRKCWRWRREINWLRVLKRYKAFKLWGTNRK